MSSSSWIQDLARAVTSREGLRRALSLTEDEEGYFAALSRDNHAGPGLSLRIPSSYLDLCTDHPDDPLRRQCVPRRQEFDRQPWEDDDPLLEAAHTPRPRLIHRYRDRALFLATDTCAMYCRHCFRRYFTGKQRGPATGEEIARAAAWAGQTPSLRELILSGGDPLTLKDEDLEAMFLAFRAARPDLVFRVATRIPVVLPGRITPELSRLLRQQAPLVVVTQFNHPRELSPPSTRALEALVDAGIPLFNQTVLLRGVNDHPDTLEELFRGLVVRRVTPYYLFQGDLAPGTAHHRVPLGEAMEIFSTLRRRLSGIALPTFAVDLPQGGGKIPLYPESLSRREPGWYHLQSLDGTWFRYPDEAFAEEIDPGAASRPESSVKIK
ncbi:KamA family radical SAM protein [Alkalispirochaeta alkalica]|uniref:KamA family radical SAM protein n=1 Tax=Alkalispirochaeta alkalica TaxID=46356 RepID=UPI000379A16C|nr:KamA family radical SAM protein [Alkalispirochaeta alkalica]